MIGRHRAGVEIILVGDANAVVDASIRPLEGARRGRQFDPVTRVRSERYAREGAEMVLRLVDKMESSKVSVAIVDPGCSELSLRRETVKDPPSLGLSARTKRSIAVKV